MLREAVGPVATKSRRARRSRSCRSRNTNSQQDTNHEQGSLHGLLLLVRRELIVNQR